MTPQPSANPLARALAAGQSDAFAELYDRLSRPMLRVACAMLGRREESEDALQDVFVNLTRSRHRFLDVEDLDAYVFASLRYAVSARLANRKREQHHLRQLALATVEEYRQPPDPDDDLSAQLASLPAEQREVIILKVDAGLTFKQIAAVLGVSLNTAASRYRYAIEKLRIQLGEQS
jgi:RNA polymerase sigma-70 factor (ECF subfamily)